MGAQLERRPTIDCLSCFAGSDDGEGSKPSGGEEQNGIDVVRERDFAKAIDGPRVPSRGDLLGPMRHRIADGTNFKPIGQRPKRRLVAIHPVGSQPDQP